MTTNTRKRLFGAAVIVLLALVVALTVQDGRSESNGQARARATGGAATIATTAHITVTRGDSESSSASPMSTPQTARNEREAKRAPTVAPLEARHALAAARVFLDGYLPYSYGRASSRRIRAATAKLVRALGESPPRVPATIARAHPRLISVRARAMTGNGELDVFALIHDGQRRYAVELEVRDVHGRWIVTEISG